MIPADQAADDADAAENAIATLAVHPAELAEPRLPENRTAENWPPTLDDKTAVELLDAIESGEPKTHAPKKVGLTYRTIARWCTKHALFAQWYAVASIVGYQARVDRIPGYASSAHDRDTAAAAKVKIEAEEKYLRYTDPRRFGSRILAGLVDPDKPDAADDENDGWIVLVPAKQAGSVIEGESRRIDLIDPEAAEATDA